MKKILLSLALLGALSVSIKAEENFSYNQLLKEITSVEPAASPEPALEKSAMPDGRYWVTVKAADKYARTHLLEAGFDIVEINKDSVSGVAGPELMAQLSSKAFVVESRIPLSVYTAAASKDNKRIMTNQEMPGSFCFRKEGWLALVSWTSGSAIIIQIYYFKNSFTISLSDQGIFLLPATAMDISEPLPVITTESPAVAIATAAPMASLRSSITCNLSVRPIPCFTSLIIVIGSSSYGSSSVRIIISAKRSAILPNSGRFHLSRPPPVFPSTQIFLLFGNAS